MGVEGGEGWAGGGEDEGLGKGRIKGGYRDWDSWKEGEGAVRLCDRCVVLLPACLTNTHMELQHTQFHNPYPRTHHRFVN